MVYVCVILAMGLALVAFKAGPNRAGAFFLACCLLNLGAAAHAVYVKDPYAFKLQPSVEQDEDDNPARP